MIKTFVLIILSFFIIQCEEVDKVLYGDEASDSSPIEGTDIPFQPENVANILMWLDSSDTSTLFTDSNCTTPATTDGVGIGCWQDKTGNNKHALQETADRMPQLDLSSQNGLNAIYFPNTTGSEETLDVVSADWQPNDEFTAFIVYFQDNSNGLGVLLATFPSASAGFMLTTTNFTSSRYKYHDNTKWLYGSSYSAGDWMIDTYSRDSSVISLYQNGSIDGVWASVNSSSAGHARIGSYNSDAYSYPYQGHIAEIVWFADTLSTENRQKMEGYLAHKWGRTLTLDDTHPYKVDPPTTFVPDL